MTSTTGNRGPADPSKTTDHAVRLIFDTTDDGDVSSAKKKKPKEGCPTLSVTCKPTMLSCSPVAQCAKFDHPGCSPLECSPVATAPPKAGF